jgi:hypothetical protein
MGPLKGKRCRIAKYSLVVFPLTLEKRRLRFGLLISELCILYDTFRMPQELFKKTVGPLRESFMVYNSQGKSKGMAIVIFQRPGDAAVAQKKYNGKIVDARMFQCSRQ